MSLIGPRLKAVIVKEVWALLRDPKVRLSLVLPPLIQLLFFSFAATLEVRNVDIGLLSRSSGSASAELVSRLDASPNFDEIVVLRSSDDLRRAIDTQQVIAALVIDEEFDRDVAGGRPASLGLVLDGRRSNAAQITGSYIATIAADVGAQTSARAGGGGGSVVINWFNPNLDFIWFNLPALMTILVSVTGLSITAQVVSRERETGTFDQLMVSPLRVHEILIGKMVPSFVLGMLNGAMFIVVAQVVFGVPFTGNLPLFVLALAAYNIALIGLGMFVSALSKTEQQSFLGSFVIMMPLVMLSGFASPVENMPGWLQSITLINPARYFLEISVGTFLKDLPAGVVLSLTWPMLAIATVTLGVSSWLFRARME